MSTKNRVEIKRPQLKEAAWVYSGLAVAAAALADNDVSLPGYGLAKALVEKETAEAKAEMMQQALREAAGAGFDVSICLSVRMGSDEGGMYLQVEMPDA